MSRLSITEGAKIGSVSELWIACNKHSFVYRSIENMAKSEYPALYSEAHNYLNTRTVGTG